MHRSEQQQLRVAILDLYEGVPNQGMRCIRDILQKFARAQQLDLQWDEYEVRLEKNLPGLDYDFYISTGGPGSPLESEGSDWEHAYFNWLQAVNAYNHTPGALPKKHVLFICHSFQLACRYFNIAQIALRKSPAFGVFPVHVLPGQQEEAIFTDLQDPFYAVDSREYQVIQPNAERLQELGAAVLAIEKERPHVPLERAVMAVRFNEYMVGTQFHPEADAIGMSMYLQREDKKKNVIDNHGFEKWESMINQLNDPDKIRWTYDHLIPGFLQVAVAAALNNETEKSPA